MPLTVAARALRQAEPVNHAYADGSQQDHIGGWGVVLLVPGQPDAHHRGQVEVSDNGACELHAVLEAVKLAPEGQPLTVHTDATTVVQAIRRGTLHPDQSELGAQVRQLAQDRGIELRVRLGPRGARRMQEAHELATLARLGVEPAESGPPHVRVRIRHVAWGAEASLVVRRGGTTARVQVPLPAREGVPPSILALAALITQAHDGERLRVRMDSALAPTLWEDPDRAAHEAARAVARQARQDADTRGITLQFE